MNEQENRHSPSARPNREQQSDRARPDSIPSDLLGAIEDDAYIQGAYYVNDPRTPSLHDAAGHPVSRVDEAHRDSAAVASGHGIDAGSMRSERPSYDHSPDSLVAHAGRTSDVAARPRDEAQQPPVPSDTGHLQSAIQEIAAQNRQIAAQLAATRRIAQRAADAVEKDAGSPSTNTTERQRPPTNVQPPMPAATAASPATKFPAISDYPNSKPPSPSHHGDAVHDSIGSYSIDAGIRGLSIEANQSDSSWATQVSTQLEALAQPSQPTASIASDASRAASVANKSESATDRKAPKLTPATPPDAVPGSQSRAIDHVPQESSARHRVDPAHATRMPRPQLEVEQLAFGSGEDIRIRGDAQELAFADQSRWPGMSTGRSELRDVSEELTSFRSVPSNAGAPMQVADAAPETTTSAPPPAQRESTPSSPPSQKAVQAPGLPDRTMPVRAAWEVDCFRWPDLTRRLLLEESTSFDTVLRSLQVGMRLDRRMVMVTGTQCGEGRSILSICLALRAKALGLKTLLVDGDVESACLDRLAGLDFQMGWRRPEARQTWEEGLVKCLATDLVLMPCGDPACQDESTRTARQFLWGNLWRAVRSFDAVIVDAGLVRENLDSIDAMAGAVQTALLVQSQSGNAGQEVVQAFQELKRAGIESIAIAESGARRKAG